MVDFPWPIFIATIISISVVSIMICLFTAIVGSMDIGPDYCQNLDTNWDRVADPNMTEYLPSWLSDHYCEYNLTSGHINFNRTRYLYALSHVEN